MRTRKWNKLKPLRTRTIIALVLFTVALLISLYPIISNFFTTKYQAIIEAKYVDTVDEKQTLELAWLKEQIRMYNEKVANCEFAQFSKESIESATELYDELLNVRKDGIMGYVEIPDINVNLPIYHGTGDDSLDRGVGHLLGSSLPTGGDSTHSVLTAHSGVAGRRLFSDLDKLEIGDVFYLNILDERIAYLILESNTVLPEDTSPLAIREGQDNCTLVTCTPYGVNSHRLMLRGVRISVEQADSHLELQAQNDEREGIKHSTWQQEYLKGVGIGFLAILSMVLTAKIYHSWPRKRGKHENW